MKDEKVHVLFADGSTSKCQSYPQSTIQTVVNKPTEASPSKKGPRATSSQKSSEEPQVPVLSLPDRAPKWITTGTEGTITGSKQDGQTELIDGVLYSIATCAVTGQVRLFTFLSL